MKDRIISVETLRNAIREIQNFPKEGIMFKDLTTAFKDPSLLDFMIETLYTHYREKGITKVVGIESRGFVLGAALAYRLDAGFVMVRKPGKLPAAVYSKTYDLEYGTDTLEMHRDALDKNDTILLHDDLLATGGTAKAAMELVDMCGVENKYISFVCELLFLKGREKLDDFGDVYSIVQFD